MAPKLRSKYERLKPPVIDANLFSAKLITEVDTLIKDATKTGEYVTMWENIQAVLTNAGVGWKGHMPPDVVGVDPKNRSKLGVGGSESHIHGHAILKAGWSWKKSSDATCSQVPPEPWLEEFKEYNDGLVNVSNGFVPQLKTLQFVSCGGSHTNTFLRAVRTNCPTPVKELQDSAGNLDKAALCANRPEFKQAVEEGMHWFILHWQCRYVWPGIIDLIAQALNTEARGDQTEVEVMLRLHELAQSLPRGVKGEVDWPLCLSHVRRSLPACGAYADELAVYVQRNSGGDVGELLLNLCMFQKAFAAQGHRRNLGGEFIGTVARLNFGPAVQVPLALQAMLEANLCGPIDKDGMCRMLKPSSVKVLTSSANREAVLLAEKMMGDARILCEKLKANQQASIKFAGRLDVRLACFLTKSQGMLETKKFESMMEISQHFLADMQASLQAPITEAVGSLGAVAANKPEASAEAAAKEEPGISESLDEMRSVKHQLKKAGVVVGAVVQKKDKDEGTLYEVKAVDEDGKVTVEVTSTYEPPTAEEVVDGEEVLVDWKPFKGKVKTKLAGWEKGEPCPLDSVAWAFDALKGAIFVAMRSHLRKFKAGDEKVVVWTTPTMVRTATACKPGDIKLAGASLRIERKTAAAAFGLGDYILPGESVKLYMHPMITFPLAPDGSKVKSPWVNPFWMVGTTDDESKANVTLEWIWYSIGSYQIPMPLLKTHAVVEANEQLLRLSTKEASEPPERAPARMPTPIKPAIAVRAAAARKRKAAAAAKPPEEAANPPAEAKAGAMKKKRARR